MRKLVLAVLVLLALLLVVDRVGIVVATRAIDSRIDDRVNAPVETQVHGFPFLHQAIQRELSHVSLAADDVEFFGLNITDARVQLRSLDVADPERPTAGSLTATVVVPYAEVARRGQLPVGSLSGNDQGQLTVRQNVDLAGSPLPVVVTGRPELGEDGVITLRPESIEFGDATQQLSDAVRAELQQRVRFQVPLDDLPSGVKLEDIEARSDGLFATLSGTDVPLNQL